MDRQSRARLPQHRRANREIRFIPAPPPIPPSISISSALASSSSPTFDLRLDPYYPSHFETTLQSYVNHLNSTNLPTNGSISTAASVLAEKLYFDNYRLLSILLIDTALIPSTTIGSPLPHPARVPEDSPPFIQLYNMGHFNKQTCLRTFFILKKKPYAVHIFYHLKVIFEFDYRAEKFRGRDAPQNPDIFRYSIVEPRVTRSIIVEENGRNYVERLEFNPEPSED